MGGVGQDGGQRGLGRQMADNGCRVGQEKAEGGKGQSKRAVYVLVLVILVTKVRVQHHILRYFIALMEFPTHREQQYVLAHAGQPFQSIILVHFSRFHEDREIHFYVSVVPINAKENQTKRSTRIVTGRRGPRRESAASAPKTQCTPVDDCRR